MSLHYKYSIKFTWTNQMLHKVYKNFELFWNFKLKKHFVGGAKTWKVFFLFRVYKFLLCRLDGEGTGEESFCFFSERILLALPSVGVAEVDKDCLLVTGAADASAFGLGSPPADLRFGASMRIRFGRWSPLLGWSTRVSWNEKTKMV